MKVIFLFDGLDGRHREYELNDGLEEHVKAGGRITITTCDPSSGNEVFIVKKEKSETK